MDDDNPTITRRRGTERKQIRLTADSRQKVEAWAEANNVSFSAAIESLALIGLQDDLATSLTPLILSIVSRTVNQGMNRFAKLCAFAAIEAGTASQLSSALLLQAIREQAAANPAGFEAQMRVARDGDPVAGRVRQMHSRLADKARLDTVQRLRKPLAELDALNAPEEDDDE